MFSSCLDFDCATDKQTIVPIEQTLGVQTYLSVVSYSSSLFFVFFEWRCLFFGFWGVVEKMWQLRQKPLICKASRLLMQRWGGISIRIWTYKMGSLHAEKSKTPTKKSNCFLLMSLKMNFVFAFDRREMNMHPQASLLSMWAFVNTSINSE